MSASWRHRLLESNDGMKECHPAKVVNLTQIHDFASTWYMCSDSLSHVTVFFFVIYLFFYSTSCSVNLYAIFLTWDPGDNPDDSVHTLDGYNAHITTWSGLDWSHIKKRSTTSWHESWYFVISCRKSIFSVFLLLNLRTHPRANVSSQGQV